MARDDQRRCLSNYTFLDSLELTSVRVRELGGVVCSGVLSSGSTMRDLAVDYARDLRVVGFYVL